MIETDDILDHVALVQTWLDDYDTGSLKADKETSREQQYNNDFFIKILGYRSKPAAPYTFEPKDTTEKKQFPDAVLRHTDVLKGIDSIAAVVELKGASIALDRPQQREGNLSPVQQAFKYKPQYRSCPFVVVSNFFEFRLYNDTQLDYESWTLRELVDPTDDYLNFKKWYVLLHADNMTAAQGKSVTEKLLSDVRLKQLDVGKDFYAKYSAIRNSMLQDVWRKNPKTRFQFEKAIQKVQTIIDRVMFACFAEDSGLLPDDTLERVSKSAQNSAYTDSLWEELKLFFTMVDKGSTKLGIPNGYNGGLFAEDPLIDALDLSDGPLQRLIELGRYDFKEDLRVNILGHVFEQSITDIEQIKRKVQNDKDAFGPQATVDEVGKRKREAIFYTPDYIVRYIVDNSLGAYLREHEERLKKKHNLAGMRTEEGYDKRERAAYTEYQYILQNIRVLDPACGSGAFLVHVFDYLLSENKRVDNILGGGLYSNEEYVRSILNDNIYGVDVNEESVEITKLSLWLKTAEKGKKLTSLDGNIKVGNSVIDDPAVHPKAFDWQASFPQVFAGGGFDVVVGNPPYGISFSPDEKKHLTAFDALVPDYEIYVYFISLMSRILKPSGYLSYIFPNTFLVNVYGAKYRTKLFETNTVTDLLDLSEDPTFADASVRTVVMSLARRESEYVTEMRVIDEDKSITTFQKIPKKSLLGNVDNMLALFTRTPEESKLITQIRKRSTPLSTYMDVSQGYIPYRRTDLVKEYGRVDGNRIIDDKEWHSPVKLDSTYKRDLLGRELSRYSIRLLPTAKYVKYGKHVASYVDPKFFTEKRMLVREITSTQLYAVVTDQELYTNPSIINAVPIDKDFPIQAALAVVNSKLMGWFHIKTSPKAKKGLFPKVLVGDVRKFPLILPSNTDELEDLAEQMSVTLKQLLDRSERFQQLLMNDLKLKSWPQTLTKWYELGFNDFLGKLVKRRLPLLKQDELRTVFDGYQEECVALSDELAAIDAKIDAIVYGLYKLSEDQIELVEQFHSTWAAAAEEVTLAST